MLVALSDLHLQDTTLSGTPDDANVPPQAFELFFHHVAANARQNRARELIILLNGDTFDLLRSERWFVDGFTGRPYRASGVAHPASAADPGSPTPDARGLPQAVEAKLLEIWAGIERSNRQTIRLLHDVASGGDPFDFPVRPRFVYVAGNHDRLINLSPALRAKVRELFDLEEASGIAHQASGTGHRASGLRHRTEEGRDTPALGGVWRAAEGGCITTPPTPEPLLPWTYRSPAYGVFARHGHEYDWANCEYNFSFRLPGAALHEDLYWETPIGDWVTLDIATYLPHRFRELYRDHPLFDHVYPHLQAIDDVRPAAKVVPWLQAEVADSREAERIVTDTLRAVLRERKDDPFMWWWLERHRRTWRWDRTNVWVPAIRLLPPALRALPPRLIRWLSFLLTGRDGRPAWHQAALEPILETAPFQYVASGHFHQPRTVLLRKVAGRPYIYFCTGSWRNRFEECQEDHRFVRLRAMNYVTFFRQDEDPDHLGRPKTTSFSLWDGMAMKCVAE